MSDTAHTADLDRVVADYKRYTPLGHALIAARLCAQLADMNCERGKITPAQRQQAYDYLSDVVHDVAAELDAQ